MAGLLESFVKSFSDEAKDLVANGYYVEQKFYSDRIEERRYRHRDSHRLLTMYIHVRLLCWQLYDGKKLLKQVQF